MVQVQNKGALQVLDILMRKAREAVELESLLLDYIGQKPI
jgi:hypothetical protein